jgi:hypothetical protein
MVHVRKAFLVSLIGFAISGIAYAQQPEMQVLMLDHASRYQTPSPFANIVIGNPNIIEVNPTSDRTATMIAKMIGTTNVLFLDARGDTVSEFEVVVSEPSQSRVRIHNKTPLMGNTTYRCAPTFCDFVEETITKEKPPERPTNTVGTSVTTHPDGSQTATTSKSQTSQ